MRRGDMGQIEQEIEAAEDAAWRKLFALGAFILVSNLISTGIGVFFGFLIWGI